MSDWPCLIRSDPHVCPVFHYPPRLNQVRKTYPPPPPSLELHRALQSPPPTLPNAVSTKEKWGLHHAGEFLLRGLLQLADSALVSEAQKGKQGAFEGGTTEVVLIQSLMPSKTAEDIPRDSH